MTQLKTWNIMRTVGSKIFTFFLPFHEILAIGRN